MEEAKRISVDVVTWNSMAYVPNLLASLHEQDMAGFTVTMVDNASTDGTLAWIQTNHPEVALLRNFRNQGFSRAYNQAISLAFSRWGDAPLESRYVLVANPDIEFAPNALRQMMAVMDAEPDVAVCGPMLLRCYMEAGSDEDRHEVVRTNVIDSTGLQIRKTRRVVDRGAGQEHNGQFDLGTEVFGFSGACVMFRASALLASKLAGELFDEDFFAYKEDVDLAWRMRRLGFKARFVPSAVAWHHRRVPSAPGAGWVRSFTRRRSRSPFVKFLSTRNHGWVILKNDTVGNLLLHLPWWLLYELAKAFACLFSWSSLKGEVASLAGISRMLRKRAELVKRAKVGGVAIRTWMT
ncbi:glycosyltransferase family 2 protein [Patescibacteria group bacterium]|nr:glycosyltransferase family 2 protein [Patescibacteria group bacterium]MBU1448400.1 glycosyltransferase family 2 protein [Patescibacteria group bacterium]